MNNNGKTTVSDLVVGRLSRYHSTLHSLEQEGVKKVSSEELGAMEGVSGAQVRRDLAMFGSFGTRGKGYNVLSLRDNLAAILGLEKKWHIAIIGTGQLSNVLIQSEIFRKKNLYIEKIFDDTKTLIGKKLLDITIFDIDDIEKELHPDKIDLAIIALPPALVQSVVNRLSGIGIRGALYFASRSVNIPDNMVVRKRDISIDLGILTYKINTDIAVKK